MSAVLTSPARTDNLHGILAMLAAMGSLIVSIILWAVAAGLVVWGEVPDLPTWIGIAIVTGAGVYTILRESRLARLAVRRAESDTVAQPG